MLFVVHVVWNCSCQKGRRTVLKSKSIYFEESVFCSLHHLQVDARTLQEHNSTALDFRDCLSVRSKILNDQDGKVSQITLSCLNRVPADGFVSSDRFHRISLGRTTITPDPKTIFLHILSSFPCFERTRRKNRYGCQAPHQVCRGERNWNCARRRSSRNDSARY